MPEEAQEEAIVAIRRCVGKLSADLPAQLDLTAEVGRFKVPGNTQFFRFALIWRQEEIARSALAAIEQGDYVVAALLSRAAMETTGLIMHLYAIVEEALAKDSTAGLRRELPDLMVNARMWDEIAKPRSVLTWIDKADKTMGGFRFSYDGLSEVAHPNWQGVSGAYSTIDQANLIISFSRGGRNPEDRGAIPSNALAAALDLFLAYYATIGTKVAALVRLCELERDGRPV